MHDAIIVGAQCAGAATAMLLARKGYKVLLVDRSRLPSDLPHGHFVHRHGPSRLARWGLLDRVLATDCPPVVSCVLDFGDYPLVASDYEAQRNAASRQDYAQIVAMAQFRPVPQQMLSVRAAVRGNSDLSRQFVLARQGLVPWESIIANLDSAMA